MRPHLTALLSGFSALALSTSLRSVSQEEKSELEKHTDYAAVVIGGGIDIYSITGAGFKLVNGSPFVPIPVPLQSQGTPEPAPSVVLIAPKQHRLFAVYPSDLFSGLRYTLWSFRLTPHGLKQESSADLPVGGFGEHAPFASDYGSTDHYFFFSVFPGFPNPGFTWELYEVHGGLLKEAAQINVNGGFGSGGVEILPTVKLDQNEHFVYVCTPATTIPPSAPSVSVYPVDNGVTFGFTSTDAEFVQAKCGS